MATNAADLPRDAQVVASVSTGQYDASQGGYSGGECGVTPAARHQLHASDEQLARRRRRRPSSRQRPRRHSVESTRWSPSAGSRRGQSRWTRRFTMSRIAWGNRRRRFDRFSTRMRPGSSRPALLRIRRRACSSSSVQTESRLRLERFGGSASRTTATSRASSTSPRHRRRAGRRIRSRSTARGTASRRSRRREPPRSRRMAATGRRGTATSSSTTPRTLGSGS